jgi:predicted GH43/DUF377 family glycosyl hydrolase
MKLFRLLVLLSLAGAACADDMPRWDIAPFFRDKEARPIIAISSNAVHAGIMWELGGLSSPSAIMRDGKVFLFYSASDRYVSRIGVATSDDGALFERAKEPVLMAGTDPQRLAEAKGGCAMPRVFETEEGVYVMTYQQRGEAGTRLAVAMSRDLTRWQKLGPVFGEGTKNLSPPGAGVIVTKTVNGKIVAAKIAGRFWMFWGDGALRLAVSTDLARWTPLNDVVLAPRKDEFDAEKLTAGVATITERGLLLVYSGRNGAVTASGEALFNPMQPMQLLLRGKFPALRPEIPFERNRKLGNVVDVTSLIYFQDKWRAYYSTVSGNIGLASYDAADAWRAKNEGLAQPQAAATLPQSKTPPSAPQKTATVASDSTRPDGALRLRAGWRLAAAPKVNADGAAISAPGFDDAAWWRATVPGTVLTTLVNEGVYPDPYFGLNNMAIPETLNKQEYWYRLAFRTPTEFAKKNVWLQFDGINYRADIWLNGACLGSVTGAFQRAAFDVTAKLAATGDNLLAVKISPPPNPGIPHEESLKAGAGPNGGQLCKDGPTFICTEGWDWIPGIRDRCAGLWQDVSLRATGPVTLGDPQVVTKLPLPATSPADVFVSIEAFNKTDQPQTGILRGSFEGAHFEKTITLAPGETRFVKFDPIRFAKPRLWWPNGYGAQELYKLNIAFLDSVTSRESDRRIARFGIREISYELTTLAPLPDWKLRRVEYTPTAERDARDAAIDVRHAALWNILPDGTGLPTTRTNSAAIRDIAFTTNSPPHLVIKVNGQPIFIRGGNWGLDDALKRVSREKLEPYIRLHRDAHLTMIRNWTGESSSDALYDLCDEYGLLVWSDFWVSTAKWNLDPTDNKLFLDNAADTIRRYRNHPSLALWCGRNEGVPAPALNEALWRLVHELDGTRYYQPDSRQLNAMPSGPWDYRSPAFYSRIARGFNSELGTPSVPEAEVMRTFIPPTEQWPISDTWAYHDWHTDGGGNCWKYFTAITNRFGEAASLDDFCRKAQVLNYESHRAMFEAWNAKLWNPCSGLLARMSHPSWPSLNWQFYTWDYDTHASYYAVRKACENVHIQLDQPNGTITVVNNTLEPLKSLKATASLYALDGKPLGSTTTNLDALANAAVTLAKAPVPASTNTVAWLLRLELRGETLLSRNDYWLATKPEHYRNMDAMPRVTLQGRTESRGNLVTIKLQNPSLTPALMVRLTLRDMKTGARILPAYYSENYFNLLPGEPRVITIETAKPPTNTVVITAHGWNVQPTQLQ